MGNGAEEGDSKVRERNEEADFNGHVGRQARRQTELTDMPGFIHRGIQRQNRPLL